MTKSSRPQAVASSWLLDKLPLSLKKGTSPELSLMQQQQQQQENGGVTLSLTRVSPMIVSWLHLWFQAFPNPELQGLSTCRPGKVLRE